jgi:hypothetical protein
VRQVTFGDLHQIGDQVMATLELHLDLGKGVTKAIAQRHKPVVDSNQVEQAQQGDRENDGGREFHGFLQWIKWLNYDPPGADAKFYSGFTGSDPP